MNAKYLANQAVKRAAQQNYFNKREYQYTHIVLEQANREGKLGFYECLKNKKLLWVASIQVESVDIGNRKENLFEMPQAKLHIQGKQHF